MTVFEELAKRLGKFTADNSPAILAGIAVAGTITTAYLAGKASVRAAEILREEAIRWAVPTSELKPRYKIEAVWKLYIPAASSAALTIACIISANQIGTRRATAMAAAYSPTERAYTEYRDKVVEKIGKNKEHAYRDEIIQDRVNDNPAHREIIISGLDVLCYDKFTGRYFTSDMETLKKAQNDTNYQVNSDYYASLTDFYNRIGLRPTGMSDEVGWNSDRLLELSFSSVLADDGRPCLAFEFVVVPVRGFYRVN
jgi:hypothetical protein